MRRCLHCGEGQGRNGSVWCDRCVRAGRRTAQEQSMVPMMERDVYREVDWGAYLKMLVVWLGES